MRDAAECGDFRSALLIATDCAKGLTGVGITGSYARDFVSCMKGVRDESTAAAAPTRRRPWRRC
jgi:hypothetical protein